MAFKETTEANGPDQTGPIGLNGHGYGLPVAWDRLKNKQCPRCTADLEEFAHVHRWTCYECGMKVPTRSMEDRNPNNGRGYFIGLTHFKDETPF